MLITIHDGRKPTISDLNAKGIFNMCCAAVQHAASEGYHVKKETKLEDLVEEHERRVEFLANSKLAQMVADIMEYDFVKFSSAALKKEFEKFAIGMRLLKERDERVAARLAYLRDNPAEKDSLGIDIVLQMNRLYLLKRKQTECYNGLQSGRYKNVDFGKTRLKRFQREVAEQERKVKALKKERTKLEIKK